MKTAGAVAQPAFPQTPTASLPGDSFRSGGSEAFGAISWEAMGLAGSGSYAASLPVWGSVPWPPWQRSIGGVRGQLHPFRLMRSCWDAGVQGLPLHLQEDLVLRAWCVHVVSVASWAALGLPQRWALGAGLQPLLTVVRLCGSRTPQLGGRERRLS